VICNLAVRMIDSLQYLHTSGIIHCNLSPSHFLMGNGSDQKVYLINFKYAKSYLKSDGQHIPFISPSLSLYETNKYTSCNGHKGWELSRRDDLESLGYILIYLIKRSLPWSE